MIVYAGKGHEQFMASAIGNDPYPGDKYVALEAINKIFKGEEDNGKEMEQILMVLEKLSVKFLLMIADMGKKKMQILQRGLNTY